MLKWSSALMATALLIGTGCEMVTSEKYQDLVRAKDAAQKENADLNTQVNMNEERKVKLIRFESGIHSLNKVVIPLAPLAKKNKTISRTNAKEGEEAGGGAIAEIFYLVQSAYAELDKRSAMLAGGISNTFTESDYERAFLLNNLQDRVSEITLEIAEVTLRSSSHIPTDRRLITSRLKALNECFLALRNLSQNKAFDLSYKQRTNLLVKIDEIRNHYGANLDSNYIPAIPHMVPIASGEDYLRILKGMNDYIAQASVFYNNPSAKRSGDLHSKLDADIAKKKKLLSGK